MSKANMRASDKISKGESVFLFFDFEDIFARVESDGCFLKRKGRTEYKVDCSIKLLTEAILNNNQITEDEYRRA